MFSENEYSAKPNSVSSSFKRKDQGDEKKNEGERVITNSSDVAIRVQNLSKCYQIYDKPHDRLKQSLYPRLQRLAGQTPKQYFREFWALRDVSFEIRKGETVGIIGRNGSGKSTLLQLICGTLNPTSGSIEVNGRVAALLELGASFNPEFTGRENVYLNAAILGMPRAEIEERFDAIVRFSELGDFINQPVKTYSSGMYVRLAFSIAINVSPSLLIVDEALSVGDARFQAKSMQRIKEIQESGATILFVSHDVTAVRTLCQEAIWLRQGRIRMLGEVFPITGRYMEYIFTDDEQISQGTTFPKNNGGYESTDTATGVESQPEKPPLDKRPVAHWGSHVGIIHLAGIFDSNGNHTDVIQWNEDVTVRIAFNIPGGIAINCLSVAFSIKDLSGTDLIVSTTHDRREVRFVSGSESVTVEFNFRNLLVTGKYLLVAAIEDRSSPTIHYYEYLEGAQYFSSVADKRYFGIFQPEIQHSLSSKRI